MGKKNTKGIQKAIPVMDASFEPPPYKTAFGMSNTEEVKRGKKDNYVQLNSCKCNDKKTNNIHRRTRTWESINNLYGDADTTEFWDDKTRTFLSSKLNKQENPKEIIDQPEINDVIYRTSNLKNTPEKLSLIGLFRKHKHNRDKRKIDKYFNEKSEKTDVKFSPYTEPELKFMSKKKPEKGLKDHYDNGVQSDLICRKGPCREAIENLYNLHALKYTPNRNEKVKKSGNNDNSKKTKTPTRKNKRIKNSKNKQVMSMKNATKDENVGYGDQISPDPLNKQDLKGIECTCNLIGKTMRHTICKCKNNNGSTLQTSSDVNNDNSKKTKTPTRKNKRIKNSKNKQVMSMKTTKDENVGYGDQISPDPLNKQDLKGIECTCNLIEKTMRHTICKCKNNNGSTLQTSSDVNNDNSKKTKTPTRKNKIIKNSKNKQVMSMKTTKDENVGYGDQISPDPLNKQDLKGIECTCNLIGKMMRHTICECKNKNEITFQTSSAVNNDNSKKTKTPTKKNKIIKNSKNKQVRSMKTTKVENVGYGDQISPDPLNKQDLKDIRRKSSFIGKIMGHTICKCKNNNGSTLQTSSDFNNDNIKKEKTKILTKETKIKKKSKNKQAKAINTAKNDDFGNAGQISPLNKQDLKGIECMFKLIGKMMRHTSKNNKGRTLQTLSKGNNPTGEPLLEMKVNVEDMRVINSSEINEKIKKLGSTGKKNMSCVCHSHINGYRVCKRGPCEQALENKHTHFDCKCRRRNIIECNDSTCDLKIPDIKVKSRKKKTPKSPVYTEENKPLFEVMLDPVNMNIINSDEIQDIVINSQNKIICPTGICNTMSKDKNTLLNCRCVGKKMTPFINECEDRTCRKAVKKCKLSYLCSRVFSKSENWNGQEENRKRRPIRVIRHRTNIKTDNYILRSHTRNKKPGVMINLPHSQTPKKGLQGNTKPKGDKNSVKKKTIKTDKKVKMVKKMSKKRRRRNDFFRKKKIDDRTLTDKFLDRFYKGQGDRQKKIDKKTKLYKKQEKLDIKENKEKEAEQKAFNKTNQYRWNYLTHFITGALNVSFETLKIFTKIPVSVLGHPLSSFVYVREKMKDPPAATLRVYSWFLRTWKNKSSYIARLIDKSITLSVITDTIENSTIYNALTDMKGRTADEKKMHEKRKILRQRRIRKRQDQALYGCQHILLTTMRKTPCLWIYHICPLIYPQCLNFISFLNNFLHLLLYCGAIMCWTPCIVGFEICRGFMCCLLGIH